MQTTVCLKDYTPPAFLIPEIDLDIDLAMENDAHVTATLAIGRNPKARDSGAFAESQSRLARRHRRLRARQRAVTELDCGGVSFVP